VRRCLNYGLTKLQCCLKSKNFDIVPGFRNRYSIHFLTSNLGFLLTKGRGSLCVIAVITDIEAQEFIVLSWSAVAGFRSWVWCAVSEWSIYLCSCLFRTLCEIHFFIILRSADWFREIKLHFMQNKKCIHTCCEQICGCIRWSLRHRCHKSRVVAYVISRIESLCLLFVGHVEIKNICEKSTLFGRTSPKY
jgi:hypothetical protein